MKRKKGLVNVIIIKWGYKVLSSKPTVRQEDRLRYAYRQQSRIYLAHFLPPTSFGMSLPCASTSCQTLPIRTNERVQMYNRCLHSGILPRDSSHKTSYAASPFHRRSYTYTSRASDGPYSIGPLSQRFLRWLLRCCCEQ